MKRCRMSTTVRHWAVNYENSRHFERKVQRFGVHGIANSTNPLVKQDPKHELTSQNKIHVTMDGFIVTFYGGIILFETNVDFVLRCTKL